MILNFLLNSMPLTAVWQSSPEATSFITARLEITETPSPSATAILIVSALLHVQMTFHVKWLAVILSSNVLRVPLPFYGGSAIAAAAPVIHADEEEVAHSISTIFLFNVISAFLFPFLGHVLWISDQSFGLWAGTAVNDTSSVVAAGYSFSNAAGNLAVIVKLTRTLMIVPVTLVLAIYTSKKEAGNKKGSYNIMKIFPWFVLGFVVASVINTFVAMPIGMSSFLSQTGKFVIVMAMASIGLNTNLVKLVKSGGKPILLGFVCWVVLALTSLGVQHVILKV